MGRKRSPTSPNVAAKAAPARGLLFQGAGIALSLPLGRVLWHIAERPRK
jgi:hypothetical protein